MFSQDHREECIFPERRSRTRKRKEREEEMENRMAQMEKLLQAATQGTLGTMAVANAPSAASPANRLPSSLGSYQTPQNDQVQSNNNILANSDDYVGSHASPFQQEPLGSISTSPLVGQPIIFSSTSTIDPASKQQSETAGSTILETSPIYPLNCPTSLQLPASPPSSAIANNYNDATSAVSSSDPVCLEWSDADIVDPYLQVNPSPAGSHHSKRQALAQDLPAVDDDKTTCPPYLSICTFPAVEWVSQQSGMSDFLVSVRRLSKAINREDRLGRLIDPLRAPEPDMETALRWTNGG